MEKRIIFYSENDLSSGMSLKRIEEYLHQIELHGVVCNNLTDVIELYNITLFFKYNLYLNSWSEEDIKKYRNQVNLFNKYIGKYLSCLNPQQCAMEYDKLPFDYKHDFFDLIDTFNCTNLFDESLITHILSDLRHQIKYLLKHRKLVDLFDAYLTDYLMKCSLTAELIIEKFYNKSIDKKGVLYFPPSFDNAKMNLALNQYLDSKDTNMNVVKRIAVAGKTDTFELNPITRLKAKHCYDLKKKELLSNANMLQYNFSLSCSKNQVEPFLYQKDELDMMLTFSEEYLINCDEIQHIHNFRNCFGLLDSKGRITLLNNPIHNLFFDDIESQTQKIKFYETNMAFGYHHQLIDLCLAFYREFLKRHTSKTLEEWLASFYKGILQSEFDYPALPMNIPLESDSYANKNKILAPEIERVLRQHDLFIQYHEINEELLSCVDNFNLSLVKSVVDKKYAYLKSDQTEWKYIMNLMFSSQSRLTLIKVNVDGSEHLDSFCDLLRKTIKIPLNCVDNYQEEPLHFLIGKGFLKIEDDNIVMDNVNTWFILQELYTYHALPYWYYSFQLRGVIDDLVAIGVLEFDNHLFSNEEQLYLSYWLNSQSFDNGPQLRNMYMHGMYAVQDEKDHEKNYRILLMILIIVVLKVEDDLLTRKFLKC